MAKSSPLWEYLERFLSCVEPGDYVAFLPFFRPNPESRDKLAILRHEVRRRWKVATTLGQGPRYLHSTGQMHKGGPDTGRYLVFTKGASDGKPIPGRDLELGAIHLAQALADVRSLRDHDRPVLRIHLTGDIDAGLDDVIEAVQTQAKAARG
jgi:hypothetical protein